MTEPLKRRTLAAFAAPCLPLTGAGLPIVIYLPPYYAGTLGLDLAMVGIIFSAVRWVDLPLDLVFGHLIDRINSRWGRFRPWLLACGLIFMTGVALVFFAAPGVSPLMAFAGLLLLYIGYSGAGIAHTSWGQALSTDYHERSRIFGWWQAGNMFALLLLLTVPPLANALGPRWGLAASPALGVHAMGWLLIALVPPSLLLAATILPDRKVTLGQSPHGWSDIRTALKLPLLRRIMLIDLLASFAPGFGGALLVFFFEAARGFSPSQSSLLLLFYFSAGLVGAGFWGWVARRTTKHGAVALACGSFAISNTILVLTPVPSFALAAFGMMIAGIPGLAPAFLVRAMLADVTDAETLATGRSNAGLYYAVLVGVTKISYAIAVGLSYVVLAAVGFDAKLGPANSSSAITGLVVLFLVPSLVSSIAAAWLARGWSIGPAEQQRIIAALRS